MLVPVAAHDQRATGRRGRDEDEGVEHRDVAEDGEELGCVGRDGGGRRGDEGIAGAGG